MIFLAILCLFYRDKSIKVDKPTILFCIFLGLSLLLIAGYTITFSGAIVRYRSVVFPFLITPLLCAIDWKSMLKKVLPMMQENPKPLKGL
jgi:cadmium resistance protein CadD (predicted permease)